MLLWYGRQRFFTSRHLTVLLLDNLVPIFAGDFYIFFALIWAAVVLFGDFGSVPAFIKASVDMIVIDASAG